MFFEAILLFQQTKHCTNVFSDYETFSVDLTLSKHGMRKKLK